MVVCFSYDEDSCHNRYYRDACHKCTRNDRLHEEDNQSIHEKYIEKYTISQKGGWVGGGWEEKKMLTQFTSRERERERERDRERWTDKQT